MGKVESESLGGRIRDKHVAASAIMEEFAQKGVPLPRAASVYDVRAGRSSGARLERAVEMAEAMKRNAAAKDNLYFQIAEIGADTRVKNGNERYVTRGFAEKIGDELGLDAQDVRRHIRAMRSELVLAELFSDLIPDSTRIIFKQTIKGFLSAYTQRRKVSKAMKVISPSWDGESMKSFYETFYRHATTTTSQTTLVPYEMGIFEDFYRGRLEMGSPLSAFDEVTLDRNRKRIPMQDYIASFRALTGIPHDQDVHYAHTNALLYGQPKRPQTLLVDEASPTSMS